MIKTPEEIQTALDLLEKAYLRGVIDERDGRNRW